MKIKVVTRLQDNGDGGYTMYVYNNNEEMLTAFNEDRLRWGKDPFTLQQIEDDPYENGYLGSDEIELDVSDLMDESVASQYQFRLKKPLSFHAGQ